MSEETKKYIVFWAWREEDTERGIEKTKEIDRLRKENPEKYPTSLNRSHARDSPPTGFSIFEATKEQLKNWKDHYKPVLIVTDIWKIVTAEEYIERFLAREKA